jgi:hypothetical protein
MLPVGATGAGRGPEAEILRRTNDAGVRCRRLAEGITVYAEFVHRRGLRKAKPASFTDSYVS